MRWDLTPWKTNNSISRALLEIKCPTLCKFNASLFFSHRELPGIHIQFNLVIPTPCAHAYGQILTPPYHLGYLGLGHITNTPISGMPYLQYLRLDRGRRGIDMEQAGHKPAYHPPTYPLQTPHISLPCTVCEREIWRYLRNFSNTTKLSGLGKSRLSTNPSGMPGGAYH